MFILAIDAGHGRNTAGKRCHVALDKNQTREWVLNSRVVSKVQEKLAAYKDIIKVVRTDDPTGKTDVGLKTRCDIANKAKADLFISVHHNAGPTGKPFTGGGICVYTYSGTKHTFQKDLYQKLIDHTGLKGNRVSPITQAGLYVLKHTKMKAVLIENGFMDSYGDVPIILSENHAERTANAIVSFVVECATKL